LTASVDVNIRTVREETINIIAACLSYLLQKNPQMLRPGVTAKHAIAPLALDLTLTLIASQAKSFPYVAI